MSDEEEEVSVEIQHVNGDNRLSRSKKAHNRPVVSLLAGPETTEHAQRDTELVEGDGSDEELLTTTEGRRKGAHNHDDWVTRIDFSNKFNVCCPHLSAAAQYMKQKYGWQRIHFLLCTCSTVLIIALITAVTWASISEEEREDEANAHDPDSTDSDQNTPPPGVHATMFPLSFHSNWTDAVAHMGAQFILERKDRGDYAMFSVNRYEQRVDIWSRTHGGLVASVANNHVMRFKGFCGPVLGLRDDGLQSIGEYYTTNGQEQVPLYFDSDEWVMREYPEVLYISPVIWPITSDTCTTVDTENRLQNSEAHNSWYQKNEEDARRRFRFAWRLTHANLPDAAIEQAWQEFWAAYQPYHYSDEARFFLSLADKRSQHSSNALRSNDDRTTPEQLGEEDENEHPTEEEPETTPMQPQDATPVPLADHTQMENFFIDCAHVRATNTALRAACDEIYTCNEFGVHSVPDDAVWSCECALQLSSKLLSGVFCPPTDTPCLLQQYALARIWDFVPCIAATTCQTGYTRVPVGVTDSGLIVSQSLRTSYQCDEVFNGGLSAFKGV
jgi:hypothetical protein